MANRIIKGQTWITPDGKLVQDQILVTQSGMSNNTVILIDDIWKDLISDKGTYKRKPNSGFFYWSVTQTNLDDEDIETFIPCPRPKDGLFSSPFKPEEQKGEWAKYWVGRFKTAEDNFNATSTLQPSKVILPESEYMDSNGNITKVEKQIIEKEGLSEISNLLFSL